MFLAALVFFAAAVVTALPSMFFLPDGTLSMASAVGGISFGCIGFFFLTMGVLERIAPNKEPFPKVGTTPRPFDSMRPHESPSPKKPNRRNVA